MNAQRYDEPFTHWVADDCGPSMLMSSLSVPPPAWPGWEARYDNDCERGKRTCRDVETIDELWGYLFDWLNARSVVSGLRELTGIDGLIPDPTLHGGGLHVTDPGGHLSPHLDYALHPRFPGWERRVNLVLFLNHEWREEWGGALELYDNAGPKVVKRICPAFDRAVLWCPGDVEFHGTQRVSDDAPPRVTAAAYYLAPARPGTVRKRALFIPQRRPAA